MTISLFLSVIFLLAHIVLVPQIENTYLGVATLIFAQAGYIAMLCIAQSTESKLKSRIKDLEDSLNDMEDNR